MNGNCGHVNIFQTRTLYGPFECTKTMRSGNADVYLHEIPGGQYTNLQFQAYSLGLGDQFEQVKAKYREANQLLGDIVKVTPSSKIVGDLAQFMVQNNLTAADVRAKAANLSFPTSVIEFFQGLIGQPYGGFPEPLRSDILQNLDRVDGRPGESMAPMDFGKLKNDLSKSFDRITDYDVMSAAMYPKEAKDFFKFRQEYGPVDKLETRHFLVGPEMGEEFEVTIEKGKTLTVKTLTPGIEVRHLIISILLPCKLFFINFEQQKDLYLVSLNELLMNDFNNFKDLAAHKASVI